MDDALPDLSGVTLDDGPSASASHAAAAAPSNAAGPHLAVPHHLAHLSHLSPLNSLPDSSQNSRIGSPSAAQHDSPLSFERDYDGSLEDLTGFGGGGFEPELQPPDEAELLPNTVEMRVRVERRMLEYVLQGMSGR
jgi:hypothetical protein